MQIEILTTKKKLTKAIVNQMRIAGGEIIKKAVPLGYLINVKKDSYKTILLEFEGYYYVSYSNWVKLETSVYRKIGRWSQTKKFNSIVECSDWWSAYQRMLEKATEQIYV